MAARRSAKKPKANPPWTKTREDVFFAELSEGCNVAAASRAAGFPDGRSAYNRKARNRAFRERYEAAVEEGFERLKLEMLERSRFGENRPAEAGESGERQRAIPTALALGLLKMHSARRNAAPPAPVRRPLKGAALRDALRQRLSEINRRMGGQG